MKEPGQMFFEVIEWDKVMPMVRQQWAMAEAAVRADERAAALEEAAKCAEGEKYSVATWDLMTAHNRICDGIAAAIRALSPSPAAPSNPVASDQSEPQPGSAGQG